MQTLATTQNGPVLTVKLNRPDVRNAFNDAVIGELTELFGAIPQGTRVVILTGEGKSFCAGADLNWMRGSVKYSEEENRSDAARMATMFRLIDEAPCAVIGRVNGHALGGGAGLIACCDMTVAVDSAKIGFTEARLGIIPAVISPFVMRRIGPTHARRFFLTGEVFSADQAKDIGLVQEVVTVEQLDEQVTTLVDHLLQCGPLAVREAKRLVRALETTTDTQRLTTEWIARLRVSPEGQEGLNAFLQKRKPNWVTST